MVATGPGTRFQGTYGAVFAAGGQSLFNFGPRRVARFDLTARKGRAPKPEKVWDRLITHAAHLALDEGAGRLVVGDTSGGHFGLSTETGEILWRTEAFGEGNAGVLLAGGSFLFTSWKGRAVRLCVATGAVQAQAELGGHMQNHLQRRADGALIYLCCPSRAELWYELRQLDPLDLSVRTLPIRLDLGQRFFQLSPDGTMAASLWHVTTDHQDIALHDATTGAPLRRSRLPTAEVVTRPPLWSPDGSLLIAPLREGFALLDAARLEPLAMVPWQYACTAAFSAESGLILLGGWSASLLLRHEDLAGWPVPA